MKVLRNFILKGFFLVNLASMQYGWSQTITGKVTNSRGEAIPYAHIVLDKSDQGTISNDSGFFNLSKPSAFNFLTISSIGFEDKKLLLSKLSSEKINIIELADSKIFMDEVIVTGSFDSATWYMQQAIENITTNYSKKKHSQIAFYREASVRDSVYSRLVEAIVLLSDKGVNTPSEKTKYEILRLRKTVDNRNIGWRQSLSNWLYQDAGVYATNKSNPTKPKGSKNSDFNEILISPNLSTLRKEAPTRLFNTSFIEDNIFTIGARFKINGETHLKVNFKRSDKELVKFFETGGHVIVNKTDYAIVEFNRWVKNVKTEEDKNHDRANYLVKYLKQVDKYYPLYIRDMVLGVNASRINGIADRKEFSNSNGKKGRIYTINELYFIENIDYEKIKWRKEMSKDDDIYDIMPTKRLSYTFDNINTLPINPISEKMLKDLTNNQSIDALFIKE